MFLAGRTLFSYENVNKKLFLKTTNLHEPKQCMNYLMCNANTCEFFNLTYWYRKI